LDSKLNYHSSTNHKIDRSHLKDTIGIRVKKSLKNQFKSHKHDSLPYNSLHQNPSQMSFYQKFLAKKMKERNASGHGPLKRTSTVRSNSRKSSMRPKKSKTLAPKLNSEIEQRINSKKQRSMNSGYGKKRSGSLDIGKSGKGTLASKYSALLSKNRLGSSNGSKRA